MNLKFKRMVLMRVLEQCFYKHLTCEKFPSHVICFRKQDIFNIDSISLNYNMSEVNLTNSSSLIDLSKVNYLCKILKMFYLPTIELLILVFFILFRY